MLNVLYECMAMSVLMNVVSVVEQGYQILIWGQLPGILVVLLARSTSKAIRLPCRQRQHHQALMGGCTPYQPRARTSSSSGVGCMCGGLLRRSDQVLGAARAHPNVSSIHCQLQFDTPYEHWMTAEQGGAYHCQVLSRRNKVFSII